MRNSSLLIALALALGVSSCTPKVGVLRAPDYKGNVGNNSSKPGDTNKTPDGSSETGESAKENATKRFMGRNISLVLPFQLDQISENALAEKDIKRAALALDYYQSRCSGGRFAHAPSRPAARSRSLHARTRPDSG